MICHIYKKGEPLNQVHLFTNSNIDINQEQRRESS